MLAGRKSSGYITGHILVNGRPKEQGSFARQAGYCEQLDMHVLSATVGEAMEFSAALRLPTEV